MSDEDSQRYIPMSPKGNVSMYRNNIRVSGCTYLDLIMDVVKGMQALHKTQLLAIRENYRQRDYISQTDYKILKGVFNRYSEELRLAHTPRMQRSGTSERIVKLLGVLPTEALMYEAEFERLAKEQQQNQNTDGNFAIRIRDVPQEQTPV